MKRLLSLVLIIIMTFSFSISLSENISETAQIVLKAFDMLSTSDLIYLEKKLVKLLQDRGVNDYIKDADNTNTNTNINTNIDSNNNNKTDTKNKNIKIDTKNNIYGNWIGKYFVDEFNEPTKQKYITLNSSSNARAYGTFSNSAVKNKNLTVKVIISKDYKTVQISFDLLEYGSYKISKGDYSGKVRVDNKTENIKANMWSRLDIKTQYSDTVIDMLKNNDTVKFYFTELSSYSSSSYSFTLENLEGLEEALDWLLN